jgi:hypothetical protein
MYLPARAGRRGVRPHRHDEAKMRTPMTDKFAANATTTTVFANFCDVL